MRSWGSACVPERGDKKKKRKVRRGGSGKGNKTLFSQGVSGLRFRWDGRLLP